MPKNQWMKESKRAGKEFHIRHQSPVIGHWPAATIHQAVNQAHAASETDCSSAAPSSLVYTLLVSPTLPETALYSLGALEGGVAGRDNPVAEGAAVAIAVAAAPAAPAGSSTVISAEPAGPAEFAAPRLAPPWLRHRQRQADAHANRHL